MNYIGITNNDGTTTKMEIVTTFKLDKFNDNYIIYTDIERKHYYIAKYLLDGKLDTNISNQELKYANAILKEVLKNVRS